MRPGARLAVAAHVATAFSPSRGRDVRSISPVSAGVAGLGPPRAPGWGWGGRIRRLPASPRAAGSSCSPTPCTKLHLPARPGALCLPLVGGFAFTSQTHPDTWAQPSGAQTLSLATFAEALSATRGDKHRVWGLPHGCLWGPQAGPRREVLPNAMRLVFTDGICGLGERHQWDPKANRGERGYG